MDTPEWKQKYPTANHAPNPQCAKCGGKGYRQNSLGYESPCICIFVDHGFANEAAQMIGEFARKELKKMQGGS